MFTVALEPVIEASVGHDDGRKEAKIGNEQEREIRCGVGSRAREWDRGHVQEEQIGEHQAPSHRDHGLPRCE
jgi:hypothetical protein